MNAQFRTSLTATALACAASLAHAQSIDQFDVRREGNNAVLQLRFAYPVQFQRAISTRSGDLTLVFYSLVSTNNNDVRATQGLRLGAKEGLPALNISDELERGDRNRKLVVQTEDAVRMKVRAGQGNRSIEIVLEGMGAGVTSPQPAALRRAPAAAVAAPAPTVTPAAPATLPETERKFLIVLQSSADPAQQMTTRVPPSLQNYDIFTSERVVNGVTRFEIDLGYFANRTQAEAVLRQLAAFPQAAIVAVAPAVTPSKPAVAAAPAPVPAPVAAAVPAPAASTAAPSAVPVAPAAPPAAVAVAPTPPQAPAPKPVPAQATAPAATASAPVPAAAPAPTAALPTPTAPVVTASPPAAQAAPAVTAAAPATTPAASPSAPSAPVLSTAEVETKAAALLSTAQAAMGQQNYAAALETLNELLNLPPNSSTRSGQEAAGFARLRSGDPVGARAEFETYLQLYPQGEGSNRVRRELAALPLPAPVLELKPQARSATETTVTGSTSMYFYGGNGQTRSQDFKDSPIAGLPQTVNEPLFTSDKSTQLFNDVDLNWRQRSSERDMRFVFRDSYTTDLDRQEKSKNRLSSLYFDYKSLTDGYAVRLGRQSPQGGGVMGRFDGVSANYLLRPKVKLGAVAGAPTDKYFDSKRKFYGVSLDADGLVPNFGVGVYAIQQSIDSEVDRRGLGLEMRYFQGGVSIFSQFDYDALIKGLNIATVQGTWILEDNTVFNALYDKRALTMLALGNSLTFSSVGDDPNNPITRIADRLATTTLQALRDQVKLITPFITQAQIGVTKPLNKTWQVGTSAQLSNTGAIPIVPDVVGFDKQVTPATGNTYTVSANLIGLNLYSSRDTHVLSTSVITSPNLNAWLVSYNNSSVVSEVWQLEPSLQYYQDRNPAGSTNSRWTPGLRMTYRGWQRWSVESNLTYELGRSSLVAVDTATSALTTTKGSSNRVNYSLGARFEF